MARTFNRIITFHVEGELYDLDTKPEDIIKNYTWTFENHTDGNIQIFGHHKDNRGLITNMTRLPRIHRWKTPDTDFSLKL